MNQTVFEQASLEARKLTSLSELLQDLMEDQRAEPDIKNGGPVRPESDAILGLVAEIHGVSDRIVEMLGIQIVQMVAQSPVPVLDENVVLATKDMLMAVADISRACDHLCRTQIAQEVTPPDFDLNP